MLLFCVVSCRMVLYVASVVATTVVVFIPLFLSLLRAPLLLRFLLLSSGLVLSALLSLLFSW